MSQDIFLRLNIIIIGKICTCKINKWIVISRVRLKITIRNKYFQFQSLKMSTKLKKNNLKHFKRCEAPLLCAKIYFPESFNLRKLTVSDYTKGINT